MAGVRNPYEHLSFSSQVSSIADDALVAPNLPVPLDLNVTASGDQQHGSHVLLHEVSALVFRQPL